MKIAVSATGPSLDAEVDPRFGRCAYFAVGDPDTMEFEFVENTSVMSGSGAGISSAQNIAGMGAQAVLTGNCGPNAYQTLSAAGVQVITGVSGTVKEAIEGYKAGRFQATSGPTASAHSGMGGGTGTGRGMGMGGGMGRGMSMGRGMGMGGGMTPPQSLSPEQEMETLRSQTEMLKQQLDAIQLRIDELQKGN
jgi:predicted Fe-Mo cluster-binding NifX family protein